MSDAHARPHSSGFAPFDIEAEYVWVECELPHYEGFKVEVRLNLKNKERKRLKIQLDEINADRDRANESMMARSKDIDDRRAALQKSKKPDEAAMAALLEEQARMIEEASARVDAHAERVNALIAPYVRNWNVMTRDDAGTLIDAPPPMVAGVEAFDELPDKLIGWTVGSVLNAYRGGKEFPVLLPRLAGPEEQPNEPSTETPNNEPREES